jgi:hypothetical protein
MDTAGGGPELSLVPEAASERAVTAARTPVRVDHQYIRHNHPIRNFFASLLCSIELAIDSS